MNNTPEYSDPDTQEQTTLSPSVEGVSYEDLKKEILLQAEKKDQEAGNASEEGTLSPLLTESLSLLAQDVEDTKDDQRAQYKEEAKLAIADLLKDIQSTGDDFGYRTRVKEKLSDFLSSYALDGGAQDGQKTEGNPEEPLTEASAYKLKAYEREDNPNLPERIQAKMAEGKTFPFWNIGGWLGLVTGTTTEYMQKTRIDFSEEEKTMVIHACEEQIRSWLKSKVKAGYAVPLERLHFPTLAELEGDDRVVLDTLLHTLKPGKALGPQLQQLLQDRDEKEKVLEQNVFAGETKTLRPELLEKGGLRYALFF
jgi:hypothetical protein